MDIFNIGFDWSKSPSQGLEPYRGIILYPGSGIYIRDISDEIQIKFTAQLTNLSKAIEFSILSYFQNHKGRLNSFWVAAPKMYYTATADIGASDTTIQIKDTSPIWLRGYERMIIIDIFGNMYKSKITGITSTTMTIVTALGSSIAMKNISLFGKLIYCRLDTDELKFKYTSPGVSECELNFIELPKEYPLS